MKKHKVKLTEDEILLIKNLMTLVDMGIVSNIHKSYNKTAKDLEDKLEKLNTKKDV